MSQKQDCMYLGFDTAKSKFDWSLIDRQGIEQAHGVVSNNTTELVALLLTVAGNYLGERMQCVVEATGIYHYPLLDACQAVDIPCIVYNPILTRQQINSTVRGKKTDRSDAFLVARTGWSGGGRVHTPEVYLATKHYGRACHKLSGFGGSFKQYHGHLIDLMADSLSVETDELLDGITRAIAKARTQLYRDLVASARGETFQLLQTIPGVGPFVAANVIGEIQDITRFPKAKQLIAYAGLDTKIKQSGRALNSTGSLTKRGSSYLRHSLFIAANVARQHDRQFKALYDKKRAEGRTYKEATVVVARKLLLVARSVWLSGKRYSVPTP